MISLFNPPIVRTKSKVKLLEKALGGKWTYDGHCSFGIVMTEGTFPVALPVSMSGIMN